MYEKLVGRLRELPHLLLVQLHGHEDVVYKAADAIEELSKQNEKWEETLKTALDYIPCWVSVTEQLPNVDTNKSEYETTIVLVAIRGWKNAKPMVYQRACVRGKTVYRWKWLWDKIYDGPPITHWMPLPEPPTEEGLVNKNGEASVE